MTNSHLRRRRFVAQLNSGGVIMVISDFLLTGLIGCWLILKSIMALDPFVVNL
jgi:hypothetical protein